jgi:Phosphatidylinositol-4-phosphate 5-Kinase
MSDFSHRFDLPQVEEMDEALQQSGPPKDDDDDDVSDDDEEAIDRPIATWTYCQNCRKVVTPLTYISDLTWKFSFGKFLEVFFYNRDAVLNAPGHHCSCNLQSAATLYFGCGKLGARFTYERVSPFGVFVRRTLPLDISFHRREAIRRLDLISVESSNLFVNFDKHIEKISREARSLFNSAVNRPEHLQTVLSELNRIGSEVDHAAKILQEKIASVSDNCRRNSDGSLNGALFRFPLFARRYLFNLTTAWNEKLSAAGQAISAMKRIAASSSHLQDGATGPNVTASIGDPLNEELSEGMKRLRQLIEHYARYNVTDITQALPSLPGGSDIQQDVEFDDDFDDPDTSIDFSDGIDADVLASRRRLRSSQQGHASSERQRAAMQRPTKTLGTRRPLTDAPRPSHDSTALTSAPPKPTPGGAVKSAITRFFNRGGRDYDQYVVDLGIFAEGRPRLAPGVDGIVVPVIDEQLSTIIAYSLASTEYAKQFKHFSKEMAGIFVDGADLTDRNRKAGPKPDLDAGVGDGDGTPGPVEKHQTLSSSSLTTAPTGGEDESKGTERRMLNRNKSHIKHTFRDVDEKGQVTCKFVCTTYWATQFHAVRQSFLSGSAGKADGVESAFQSSQDVEQSYIESLSSAYSWAASGGKSGASFARTADDRFVIKCISRTELQMFLDCAPAYFEYLSKAFFHGL